MVTNDSSIHRKNPEDLTVRHEPSAQRFAVRLNKKIGYLSYENRGWDILDYAHVFVPPEFRGQGIAAQLTKTALDYARKNGFAVIPSCPYVDYYLRKHPEYNDVVVSQESPG
ncbi:N-acetyltransferase [bacterium]|nr:N-acetyltransferase [bacterium]